MARALSAIDVKDFARHETGRFQVENRLHDVTDFAHAFDWMKPGEKFVGFRRVHRRLDGTWGDGIYPECPSNCIRWRGPWWPN